MSGSSQPDSEIVIRVRGMATRFGEQIVHDDLNLEVRRGEIIGVIGPSGCGKSVLMRSIVGLDPPTEGSIEVLGQDVWALDEKARKPLDKRWGVMFQEGALFSTLTLKENVALPLQEYTDLSPDLIDHLAALKLAMTGLEPNAFDKRPSQISGGMRKRAALARALSLDPELLFLDEPTAGLDPVSAGKFDRLIRELRDAMGLTVFLVTHDLDTLYAVTDRVAVLMDRKVAALGPVEDVSKNATGWIGEYFGGPRGRKADLANESALGAEERT